MSGPLRQRWSEAVLRRGAVVLLFLSLSMALAAVVLDRGIAGRPGLSPRFTPLDLSLVTVGTVVAVVGLLLTWARPRNSVGWLVATSAFLLALTDLGETYGERAVVFPGEHLRLGLLVMAVTSTLWLPALVIPGTVLLGRYPTGRISDRWARLFDRAFIVGLAGLVLWHSTSEGATSDDVAGHTNPIQLPHVVLTVLAVPSAALVAVGALGILATSLRRMFRASYPERQQLAWLFTTAVLSAVLVLFTPFQGLGNWVYAAIQVAIAVGVVRYRLLGIQVVLRRTLVYGSLTGVVLLVFVAVTAGLAGVVPHDPVPQLVAAIVVAVGVVPLRDWLQRHVDRFVYGDRRDPVTALARLGTPMGTTADEVVPAVLAAVASALRSPGAAVLETGHDIALASYGDLGDDPTRVPLAFAGVDLGLLAIAPRPGEGGLASADLRLLEALAPLVAAAVHAERLTADLRAARSRVVTATAVERGRLRQELHDGLGPSLTGVGLGLEAVESRLGGGDARTAEMLARLRAEVARALEDVRRIIDGLRPAVFDEVDLATALRRRAEQLTGNHSLTVDVAAPASLPPLTPECETAAYRIADEALTNVVRHASATRCDVVLCVEDGLHLVVADNGQGINGSGRHGVGLASMRQRAEALGGSFTIEHRSPGTAIVVDLPVTVAR